MPVGFSKELPHRGAMKFLFPLAVLSSTMLEYRNWTAELEVQESQRAYEIAVSKIQSALGHVFAMSNPQKLGKYQDQNTVATQPDLIFLRINGPLGGGVMEALITAQGATHLAPRMPLRSAVERAKWREETQEISLEFISGLDWELEDVTRHVRVQCYAGSTHMGARYPKEVWGSSQRIYLVTRVGEHVLRSRGWFETLELTHRLPG